MALFMIVESYFLKGPTSRFYGEHIAKDEMLSPVVEGRSDSGCVFWAAVEPLWGMIPQG